MNYLFKCVSCGKKQEKEICIKEYDILKNFQKCDKCGGTLKRVIEWEGIATGADPGWCGKSTGNAI